MGNKRNNQHSFLLNLIKKHTSAHDTRSLCALHRLRPFLVIKCKLHKKAVLRIRIRIRIHMFLGLPDPDPPLDPDPDPPLDPDPDPSTALTIYLSRVLCLSFVLSYSFLLSCHPVILSSCHICGTLSYSLCLRIQTDGVDETEGFEREGLQMER
jgi:hypothetical protein